jgi:hypothetical protein
MVRKTLKKMGAAGQWLGLFAVSAGLFYQIRTGAPLGYSFIAGGSVCFAVFTKFKHEVKG